MSMITRCPACDTMFRVVPDQLRISAGWVRCGQCDEIFDASVHLLDETPFPVSSEPTAIAALAAIDVSEYELPETPLVGAAHLEELPVPAQLSPSYASDFQEVDLNLDDLSKDWGTSFTQEVNGDKAALDNAESRIGVNDMAESPVDTEVEKPSSDFDEAAKVELSAPEPLTESISFLSTEIKPTVPSRPLWRWTLLVFSFLLLLGLISQGIYRERQQLAAWEPQLAPWLEHGCAVLGCTIGPVMRIDSIVVDSSTFVKLRTDTYRLSFILKNSALTPVAFPAIELTLTDALDRPFLRRVLPASDQKVAQSVLLSGEEKPVSIDIVVEATSIPGRVAGYRLVAFYP